MSNAWFQTRETCPACGSDRFKIIYESPYDEPPIKDYLLDFYTPQGVEMDYLSGATFILCSCTICGLIFQQDVPGDTLMARLYGHWGDHENALRCHHTQSTLSYRCKHAQEIMRLIEFIGRKPSVVSVLDFGMGWGDWSLMAKAFGCASYGTELSAARREYASKNGITVIAWDEILQHRFDFINTEQVFEHIAEPYRTLLHLKAALNNNGILKISVPAARGLERRIEIMDWKAPKGSRNSLNPIAPLEHINCYKRASITRMAYEAEMEEVTIPWRIQYRYMTEWNGAAEPIRRVLRPLLINKMVRQNSVFLRSIK